MSKNNLEQLAAAQKANAEVMMALARSAFKGMEQLTALNLSATRDFFNEGVANAQQLLKAKDPQELAQLNASLARPNVEKMVEYSRNVAELVTAMQKDITSVMESQYSSFTQNASTAFGAGKAPVGNDVFAAAMNSMLQASTKAYDNMTQMARQMADLADTNLKTTASSATAKAAATTAVASRKKA